MLFKPFFLIISGFVLVFILLKTTDLPNAENNGFKRTFHKNASEMVFAVDDPELQQIVGYDGGKIYFSKVADPFKIITFDSSLSHRAEINLCDRLSSQAPTGIQFAHHMDTTDVFLIAYREQTVYAFPQHFLEPADTFRLGVPIVKGLPLSRHAMVYLKWLEDPLALSVNKASTTQQLIEGPLVTGNGRVGDGHLIYNNETATISYVHLYHNKVMVLDTNLNPLRAFSTIDTVSHEGNSEKLGKAPPLVTNLRAFTHGTSLFVCSGLKADNESRRTYFKHIPVDVYNLLTGEYQWSFYLPLHKNKLIKSAHMLSASKVAVLYHGNHLAIYQLNLPAFIP